MSKNFEKSITRLEEIVSALESNELSLEEAVKLYKEGISLSEYCSETLEAAEMEINVLKKNARGFFEKENWTYES